MHIIAFLFFLAVLTGISVALWQTLRDDWSLIVAALGIRVPGPSAALEPRIA